jgi:L-malate glycosyltransferase
MGIVRSAKHEWAYRRLGGLFDQVQAVSDAARQACIARDGLAPERVLTVHNGVHVDEIDEIAARPDVRQAFGLKHSGPIVITVAGTIAPVKGIDVLLEAAALVCRQMPGTNFLVLGWSDNAYVQRTPALLEYNRQLGLKAEALGIASNVRLGGWIPDVAAAMKACDVFCQPSRSEGLSNALLEAMASGLPSVATAVGGNPEVVVAGETGYLVPPEDAPAMAARVLELLGNARLRNQMGAAGRKQVRTLFSLDAMAARMAQSYEAAIRHRRERR